MKILEIFKEASTYSYERCRNTFLILIGTILTMYLIFTGKSFQYYEVMIFAFVVAPSGFGVYNKYINSKYNTPSGSVGKPLSHSESIQIVTGERK